VIMRDLNEERQFLLKKLQRRGAIDEEIAQMKREIDLKLLSISHLRAVAGKALARVSVEKHLLIQSRVCKLQLRKWNFIGSAIIAGVFHF